VVVLKPVETETHVTILTPIYRVPPPPMLGAPHHLLPVGGILLMECLSTSRDTVLSAECHSRDLCSTTHPHFTKRPSAR
jgi:hypothetical protein